MLPRRLTGTLAVGLLWGCVSLSGCAQTATVRRCWQPAEMDVSGMQRLAIVDFSGVSGQTVTAALNARLWDNRFYSVVDGSELTSVQHAAYVLDPGDESLLAQARERGIDGVVFGEVHEYRCEDQALRDTSRQMLVGKHTSDNEPEAGHSLQPAGSAQRDRLRREARVAVTFRLVDARTGDVRAAKETDHHFSGESGPDSSLPPSSEVLADLTAQCLDDFVEVLAPHQSDITMKLACGGWYGRDAADVRSGNRLAGRGDWDAARDRWQVVIDRNAECDAASSSTWPSTRPTVSSTAVRKSWPCRRSASAIPITTPPDWRRSASIARAMTRSPSSAIAACCTPPRDCGERRGSGSRWRRCVSPLTHCGRWKPVSLPGHSSWSTQARPGLDSCSCFSNPSPPLNRKARPASKGRQCVATGGAQSVDRRTERNPWSLEKRAIASPGRGTGGRLVVLGSVLRGVPPSPLRGSRVLRENGNRGFRSRRRWQRPLHRWLQTVAPTGASIVIPDLLSPPATTQCAAGRYPAAPISRRDQCTRACVDRTRMCRADFERSKPRGANEMWSPSAAVVETINCDDAVRAATARWGPRARVGSASRRCWLRRSACSDHRCAVNSARAAEPGSSTAPA